MMVVALASGALRWGGFALGVALVLGAWRSVIRTVVQPRSGVSRITWLTWRTTQGIFLALARRRADYARKDALLCFLVGHALIFWPLLPNASLGDAFSLAGASLFTLGAAITLRGAPIAIEFIAAASGMIVVALQIGYLPAIYSAYNRREALVTALSIRAGAPPTAQLGTRTTGPRQRREVARDPRAALRSVGVVVGEHRRVAYQLSLADHVPLTRAAALAGHWPARRAR